MNSRATAAPGKQRGQQTKVEGGLLGWAQQHPAFAFLLLSFAIVALVYGRTLTNPFVYDDVDQVVKNPNLSHWPAFVARFLKQPVTLTNTLLGQGGTIYRPVFWLSLFLDRTLWGLRAGGYHLTNLCLHLIDANLAFLLLRRLRLPVGQAAAASLLWLVLPINSEVVAWISGRSYALCLLFLLLTLLLGLRQLRSGGVLPVVGCLLAATLALGAHESGILAAPLFLLVAYAAGELCSPRLWQPLAAMLAAVALWWSTGHALGVHGTASFGSVWSVGLFLGKYLAWIALPLHLSVERSTSTPAAALSAAAALALAALVAAASVLLALRRRLPALSAGLAWTLVCLLPFSGLLRIYQGMAERFAYIASLGFALAVVAVAAWMARQRWRVAGLGLLACWIAWSVGRVELRVGDWTDPARLYRSSLTANPHSPVLAYNLGHTRFDTGDLAGAMAGYEQALVLQPSYPHAYASIGDVYLRQGRFAEAQTAYQRSLADDPTDVSVILNSGVAYERAGHLTEAEQTFQRAIAMAPQDDSAQVDLGTLYMQEKRWNDAASQFVHAIDTNTADPTPYYDLAVLLQRAGKNDLALRLYQKVLALKPNDPDTLENLRKLQEAP
jgi:protein O-mannosyl-transferase